MRRGIYLAVLGMVLLGAVIVRSGGAQVYPVRWDEQQSRPQRAAPTPPSLVLADGGLEFPDGSVQTTAAASGPPAPVPRTGQSAVVASGDDGYLQLGVVWPNPRFAKNGDGTVTDNLTGLIWLEEARCFAVPLNWADALLKAAELFDGCSSCGTPNVDCGLGDGSTEGMWRLPNVRELHSLVHFGLTGGPPAIPNTSGLGQWLEGDPFSLVQAVYWSSTTDAFTGNKWFLDTSDGSIDLASPSSEVQVWLVRGP